MNGTYYFLKVENLNPGKRIENRADENLKNFNLNFGFFYLITDTPPVLTYFIMKNRLSTGSQGIFLSDTPEENYRKNFNGDYAIKTMSEFGQNLDATSFYDSVLSSMNRFPDKSVILMEKLDSLVLRNGFKNTINFVYDLREVTHLKSLITIMTLNSDLVNGRFLRLLEKESTRIELGVFPKSIYGDVGEIKS